MNKEMIRYSISQLMLFSAILMLIPLAMTFFYQEPTRNTLAFLGAIIIIVIVFGPGMRKEPSSELFYVKEGLIITSTVWILMSIFGGLPFYFSGVSDTLVDAFFEAASGFSATGTTLIQDVEVIDKSILFWRALTHYIGGMGVLVLALAVLPEISMSSVQMLKAEMTGPQFSKLLPRIKTTTRTLYTIYFVFTLILTMILKFLGMPMFDAVTTAFSSACTGGFAVTNAGVASYNSPAIEWVLTFSNLFFSVNFNLYFFAMIGRGLGSFRSEELRVYLSLLGISILVILFDTRGYYNSFSESLRKVTFTVTSVSSSSGFSIIDFQSWPDLSKMIIFILSLIGGCAGSTADGLKVSRVIILVKAGINELKRVLQPHRVLTLRYEGKAMDQRDVNATKGYFLLYIMTIVMFVVTFVVLGNGFNESVTSVMSLINNLGTGYEIIGSSIDYANSSNLTKITAGMLMILARLEIFPVVILFMKQTWKEY